MYVIHHPKHGYWQTSNGYFPNIKQATKYASEETAWNVIAFNPRLTGATVVAL